MKVPMPLTSRLRILAIAFLGSWPTRAALSGPKSAWLPGTIANGSTTHPGIDDGTKFYSSYAIDGDTNSKWNDDTPFALPDILTIETPSPVNLAGIILLSAMDGWVLNYTVETFNGSGWAVRATVTNCESPLRYVPFTGLVETTQLRIVVTDEQDGGYTRIHEVYPVLAEETSDTSESNPTRSDTTPNSPAQTSTISSSSVSSPSKSPKSYNIGAIVGGVLGGIILMLSSALAALLALILLRKRKERSPYSVEPKLIQPDKLAPDEWIPPAELSTHRYGIPGGEPFQKAELEGPQSRVELR